MIKKFDPVSVMQLMQRERVTRSAGGGHHDDRDAQSPGFFEV